MAKKLRDESPSRRVVRKEQQDNDAVERTEEAINAASITDLPETSFSFQQRHGKLDFRAIARVDLDALVRDRDIDTLQRHLENICFAEVGPADMRSYTDEHFIKLFRLTQ